MPVVRLWRRGPDAGAGSPVESVRWEFEVRPRRSVRTAWIVAVLMIAAATAAGIGLRRGATGVNFRFVDQVAMIGIGVLGAFAVLMLTRPRVRVNSVGVSVRNVLGDTEFPWEYIRGVSFPDRKSWARLELINDDYVPLMAIRANDKEYAARALEKMRELGAKYTKSPGSN